MFLAPPAERQRSFSNADSSVVVRRQTFQLKAWFLNNCLITFFLFWYVASLGWYQCIVRIWIWLNHSKGHFERSERSNLAPFLLGGNFLKNCFDNFFSICKKLPKEGTNELPKDGFDWITLKVIFQGPKGLKKVKFGCFCYFWPIYSKAVW